MKKQIGIWFFCVSMALAPAYSAMASETVELAEPGVHAETSPGADTLDNLDTTNEAMIADSQTEISTDMGANDNPIDASQELQSESISESIDDETETYSSEEKNIVKGENDSDKQNGTPEESELTTEKSLPWYHISLKDIFWQVIGGIVLICLPGCYIYWKAKH